jgi:thiamine biosynthesis lipoprotein ApbE
VALAGDIRVMGKRPDSTPWRIGVQHPRRLDKILAVLELSDKSISTSGDYGVFRSCRTSVTTTSSTRAQENRRPVRSQ